MIGSHKWGAAGVGTILDREEYIEQAYFFRTLNERMQRNMSTQDLLVMIREEILSTTKLPLAIDFLGSELRLTGVFASAMARLSHYFTPFQTFVVAQAEHERGKFDFTIALEILEREAEYRSSAATRAGLFMFQFESLCRNRLGYDKGLEAVSLDPMYDRDWKDWIDLVRRQIGIVDLPDLVFVRSEHYVRGRLRQGLDDEVSEKPVLFGEKEGKIAAANRRKDPLLFFSALQRQLNYPAVPRPKPVDELKALLPSLLKRFDRLESRVKLLEEEQRGGIDITRFYGPNSVEPTE